MSLQRIECLSRVEKEVVRRDCVGTYSSISGTGTCLSLAQPRLGLLNLLFTLHPCFFTSKDRYGVSTGSIFPGKLCAKISENPIFSDCATYVERICPTPCLVAV